MSGTPEYPTEEQDQIINEPDKKTLIKHIKIVSSQGDLITDELALMELQGEFEHSETPQFDSLQLGLLKESSKGNYDVQIGNHLLKGKSVDLPKPLIMTEKFYNEETNVVSYVVRAIIKKKILFSGRPTPLRTGQSLEAGNATKIRKIN